VARSFIGAATERHIVSQAAERFLDGLRSGPQQSDIRLGFGIHGEPNRILDADHGAVVEQGGETSKKAFDAAGVDGPDRSHLDAIPARPPRHRACVRGHRPRARRRHPLWRATRASGADSGLWKGLTAQAAASLGVLTVGLVALTGDGDAQAQAAWPCRTSKVTNVSDAPRRRAAPRWSASSVRTPVCSEIVAAKLARRGVELHNGERGKVLLERNPRRGGGGRIEGPGESAPDLDPRVATGDQLGVASQEFDGALGVGLVDISPQQRARAYVQGHSARSSANA